MGKDVGPVIVRNLGLSDFVRTWRAMQAFTFSRDANTPDEIWLTEHPPVYTLGLNKRGVSLPRRADIPLIETDRGGKITYHGPGQIILYLLLDINRRNITIKQLVNHIETNLIELLKIYGITAETQKDAPGVYVNNQKIASLGLRVKKGYCYHGISLNVDMDLSPFSAIDPCGYKGLQMTQMRNLGVLTSTSELAFQLAALFGRR